MVATALDMARTVLGRTEGRDRQALIDYMKTGGQNIDPVTRAWCADFVNASLARAGYSGTGSGMARSFLDWGNAVDPGQVQAGDIGVYPRGSDPAKGHVGIVERVDPNTGMVTMVSGNAGPQGAVTESQYALNQALGFRRAAEMKAAGYSPQQIQAAFLQTIRGPESNNQYNVLYGGETFQDMSKHPGRRMPIMKDGRVEGYSTASGAYGMTADTWADLVKQYGYKDFSKETQDKAAWQLAQDRFKAATKGGSLEEALSSGDPGRINAAAQVLNQTWASLPGGKQPGKAYAGTTYADVFSKALGPGATDSPSEGGSRFGGAGLGTPPTNPYELLAKKDKKKNALETFGEGISDAATAMAAAGKGMGYNIPAQPSAARVDVQPVSSIDPQAAEMRRQQLAMAMQRLNQGTLV